MAFGLSGTARAQRRRRTEEMLELVGLPGHGDRVLHELSGGIFLLRHPASKVSSLTDNRPDRDPEATVREVRMYVDSVQAARNALPGLTVRSEELTTRPEAVTQDICVYPGVPWTSKMLDYRKGEHGPFVLFIGDWSDNIKSGKVQKARPLPDPEDVPAALRDVTRAWGYAC